MADLEDDDETDTDEIADDEESEDNAEEFHGYRCTVDCSGHEAGYRWAEEHDISDPDMGVIEFTNRCSRGES